MSSLIDLSQLPPPDVVEALDFETIFAARKARLISLYPPEKREEISAVLELESEPLVLSLQENAYRELVLRQRINEAAQAVMLAYAKGADLEQIAALFELERLQIKPADPVAGTPAVMEEDADLRMRIQLAPQSFSVAGPEGAYRSHALNTDGRVLDASATSPQPCEVLVTVLSREGDGTAPQDLLDKVAAGLRSDDVRPLTDLVTVQSARILPYQVAATIYTFPGPDSSVVLELARKRLAVYVEGCHRLGREVAVSGLHAALHVDGVERVDLHEPAGNVAADLTQAPFCTAINVLHGGIRG
ncbi:Baseplate assembly protein [Ralstonia mannitolilytica]|uniref:baseplate J/gp47 family protein n=1 Tax=Ralstonia mannitolilytica TaxID=105219 RepID=UPI0039B5CB97